MFTPARHPPLFSSFHTFSEDLWRPLGKLYHCLFPTSGVIYFQFHCSAASRHVWSTVSFSHLLHCTSCQSHMVHWCQACSGKIPSTKDSWASVNIQTFSGLNVLLKNAKYSVTFNLVCFCRQSVLQLYISNFSRNSGIKAESLIQQT